MPVSVRLSELSPVSFTDLTDSDLFLITDSEATASKKLTFANLKQKILERPNTEVNNLKSIIGSTDTNDLGSFTGSLLPNDSSVKVALQLIANRVVQDGEEINQVETDLSDEAAIRQVQINQLGQDIAAVSASIPDVSNFAIETDVNTSISEIRDKIDELVNKFLSVDERIESMITVDNITLRLEDNTVGGVISSPTFFDGTGGGDTTTFVVDTDDRGVYTLDGVPQPTIEVPRGDIIEFDLSGLYTPSRFEIYRNGVTLNDGVTRVGTTLRLDTSQVPLQITKAYYKDTITSGLGWVINIVDN